MNPVDTPQARGQVGLAWGDITPPVGIYHRMWGAATHDRSTSVHRLLRASALWLASSPGAGAQTHLLLALDHCLLDRSECDAIRRSTAKAAGLTQEQIVITLSHTHGAGLMSRTRADFPGGDLIAPYLDEVARRCGDLARQARAQAQSATLVFGSGRCALAAHRDFHDEARHVYACGFNPEGPADDTVLVIRIVADAGQTLGSIVNYACHPTTLAWDNTSISPDYVGALRETVERDTGAPCLFLQGASGDLGPRVGFVGDHAVADRNGRQLGFAALSAWEALPPAGTRFVYRGPVVSGALIGTWAFEPLPQDLRDMQANWRVEQWTEDLPYRPDLPTLEQTQRDRARWEIEEAQAKSQGDTAKARDCRAQAERMTRQLNRLAQLPPGKTYPLPVDLWRWGDAYWLFVPGEHYQFLQVELRKRFPRQPIVVATIANDWQPGYLPPASTYGYGIYQETIAAVGAGSAELLVEAITRKMRAMSENSVSPRASGERMPLRVAAYALAGGSRRNNHLGDAPMSARALASTSAILTVAPPLRLLSSAASMKANISTVSSALTGGGPPRKNLTISTKSGS